MNFNIVAYPNYLVIRLGERDFMVFCRPYYDRIAVEWILDKLKKAFDIGYQAGKEERRYKYLNYRLGRED